MPDRILRLTDDGTEIAEIPADASTGVADAGRVVVLGAAGVIDGSALPVTVAHFYVHEQPVPSSSWHVVHGLGRRPNASVTDSAGDSWLADVRHVDANGQPSVNECFIDFDYAFSGWATLS